MKEEEENKKPVIFYCYGRNCPLKDNCFHHTKPKDLPNKWRGEYGLIWKDDKKQYGCEYFINKNFSEN